MQYIWSINWFYWRNWTKFNIDNSFILLALCIASQTWQYQDWCCQCAQNNTRTVRARHQLNQPIDFIGWFNCLRIRRGGKNRNKKFLLYHFLSSMFHGLPQGRKPSPWVKRLEVMDIIQPQINLVIAAQVDTYVCVCVCVCLPFTLFPHSSSTQW